MINHSLSRPRLRIAVVFHGFSGGGMETVMMRVAAGIAARGHAVEFVVKWRRGELADRVPTDIPIYELGAERPKMREYPPIPRANQWIGKIARRTRKFTQRRLNAIRAYGIHLPALLLRGDPLSWRLFFSERLEPLRPLDFLEALPGLVRYLKLRHPDAILVAEPHYNIMSVFARRLARVPSRIVITEHVQPSEGSWRHPQLRDLLRRGYHAADAIVSVSDGVGDDLASVARVPREQIITIHNPVVSPDILALAEEPADHPWFALNAPPVVLAAGRIHPQKDFPTLIRAFSRVHAKRMVRLVILGAEGHDCVDYVKHVRSLPSDLGVAEDVDFPGFVVNPFTLMRRAGVFVLSSAYEGLGNVLIEAMACGCPVISTNCQSGPCEILDRGRYGPLVPVGDDAAMAAAIETVLDKPIDSIVLEKRASLFSVERAVDLYLQLLVGSRSEEVQSSS